MLTIKEAKGKDIKNSLNHELGTTFENILMNNKMYIKYISPNTEKYIA